MDYSSENVRGHENSSKGRTIRKVMGGGGWGIFSLQEFFFMLSACAGIFFSVDTLCTNFFFFVVFQKKKIK